ncbi:MAG: cytochrome c biogenesis protein CcsA [bacterium]
MTQGTLSAILPLSLFFMGLFLGLIHLLIKKRRSWAGRTCLMLMGAGILSQCVTLMLRWISGGHFPVVGLFEALFFFSFCLAFSFLYLSIRAKRIGPGVIATLVMAIMALIPCIWIPKPVASLTPALDTPLFLIHVLFSFIGYAYFAAAAGLGGEFLLTGDSNVSTWIDHTLLLGFSLFTLCMIAGAIWAYLAWESYWMWNLKGIWSFSLWLFYAGIIHHRFFADQERPSRSRAIYAIIGFILTLFTFLGLGLLMRGTHRL